MLDAQYRSVQKFGAYELYMYDLMKFTTANAAGNWNIHGGTSSIPDKEPMPHSVTNDVIYNQWHASLSADKTAKENCDIWMGCNYQTDSQGIKGVPAVAWCRNQVVDGKACDLPNEYETIVLWSCGDKLDEIDPTAATYPDLRLGYTSTTAMPGYGRRQKFNGVASDRLFSSTECDSIYLGTVGCNGRCNMNNNKRSFGAVVPVLEL